MSNTALPIASVERIIREAGVSRIGQDATKLIIESAVNHIKTESTKAYTFAQHAGRNTLKAVDVEAAQSV